jgi:phage terminase large subunit
MTTNPGASESQPLSAASQKQLKSFFQLGLEQGCPRDQLLNFSNVGVILQPRQLAASAAARLCDKPDGPKAIGYGGARGGGKSHWLVAQMGADDCQRMPELKCLLLRKVGKSNLESFEDLRQRVFKNLPHEFNASRGFLTFENGSLIRLGHYQSEKDIDSYLGREFDVIGIEEATQLTYRKYEDISTCCRTSKPDWRPRIYSTTNPGGIGHQWYYEKFIVPNQTGQESVTCFIPARVDDNAFINPEYKSELANLTGWKRDAWRDGLWTISAGQYFRTFNPAIHVLTPDFKPAGDVEWFAALDYGYTHFTAVLLACQDQAGNIYVVDEHAERLWIPQSHAKAIKAMCARNSIYSAMEHLRENLLARFPDPCKERDFLFHQHQRRLLSRFVAGADIFKKESGGESIDKQYRAHGINLTPANMDRESGWSAILQRLGDPDAGIKPTLFIHPRCRKLIACLPFLQHDLDRPGDVLKSNINEEGLGGDDLADALRYLVATPANKIHERKLSGF